MVTADTLVAGGIVVGVALVVGVVGIVVGPLVVDIVVGPLVVDRLGDFPDAVHT